MAIRIRSYLDVSSVLLVVATTVSVASCIAFPERIATEMEKAHGNDPPMGLMLLLLAGLLLAIGVPFLIAMYATWQQTGDEGRDRGSVTCTFVNDLTGRFFEKRSDR